MSVLWKAGAPTTVIHVFFASLLLGLAACSGSPQETPLTVKNPDTYTYVTAGDVDSLDPAWSYDSSSRLIAINVYEGLLRYQGSSTEQLEPLLATQVPTLENGLLSADGLTYTFPIREGVRFHQGGEVGPEDVRYSLLRFLLQDRVGGPSSLLLEPIFGRPSTRDEQGKILSDVYREVAGRIQVEGKNLIIRLPRPYAPLLSILAAWSPVVSKQWATENGDWDGEEDSWQDFNNPGKEDSHFFEHANGTGAFQVERWDRKNREIVLVRNEDYWRTPARLGRVVVRDVSEFATRKLMISAGDADSISALRSQVSQLEGIPGVRVVDGLASISMAPVVFFTFQINPSANPYIGSGKLDGEGIPSDFFADIDLRKGFAHALDYEGFIRDVYRGQGTRARGCIPKNLPGHDPETPVYAFDLAQAEEHFRRAWGGRVWEQGFHFTATYNQGNTERQVLCQMIKRNVEQLNPKFKIDIRPLQWSSYLDASNRKLLPLFVLGWGPDFPDAHNFVFPFLHSRGNYPALQGYRNATIEGLIESAIRETQPEKRKALYSEVLRLAHRDVPHLVVIDRVDFHVQRSWVQGYHHNPITADSSGMGDFHSLYKEIVPASP